MANVPRPGTDKARCFAMWQAGKPLAEIQAAARSTAKTVRQWVREWERGWEVAPAASRKPGGPHARA